ncbi:MAG: hypothetical protein ACXQS8_03025 [Candidatus Helarchaeales archaeon]
MGRRIYVKGKKTHAKGEEFKHEQKARKDRYYINIGMVSLKTIADYDIDWTGEFYIKCGQWPRYQVRTPTRGTIQLEKNEAFVPGQNEISLYTQFLHLHKGDSKIVEIPISIWERDLLKKDKKVASSTIKVNLSSEKSEYIVVQDEKERTKLKLKVYGGRTKY